ncbi:hypothetical protein BN000_04994 [Neobacillus massiliamazoniensis]|uniref:Uncharacterized protein n=1 Tax=Neobacillus massiliamazoniensis TaxID=1499688 RepID=A0A0U1P3S2_9BACI|nr:hypothetical protein BN000_04994 [Neobacillus massiliamazoniensis]
MIFETMLIRAEGARLFENAIAFPSCVGGFKDVIQCPVGLGERPHRRLSAKEAPWNARGFSLLERKSTGKFNTAKDLERGEVYV